MQGLIHNEQLKGHRAAVLGAGRSGLSAAALLKALGAHVRILEQKTDFDPGLLKAKNLEDADLVLGAHQAEHLRDRELIVVSPGIPWSRIQELCPAHAMVVSELELASWFLAEPILAVTGTNGKTTTCMLISHVLEKTGRKVFTGGNIGTPLSDYVLAGDNADILVLEVSSFQLQGCSGFKPNAGVLLNFSANHLDQHQSEQEYFLAKMRLFSRQSPDHLAILPLELKDSLEGSGLLPGKRAYFAPANRFSCPALPGEHNQANLEAAFLACRFFGIQEKDFAKNIQDFTPPQHRQEVFLVRDGITYVNDSKATTLEAMAAALNAFDRPIRLLAGGKYKGGDFSQLAPLIRTKAAKVYLFGESKEIFESAWGDQVQTEYFPGLEQAAQRAVQEAKTGECVLLSPGTSSFDLFSDYQARGEAFKDSIIRCLGQSENK